MSVTEETRREAYHVILPKIPPMAFKVMKAVERLGDATAEEIMAAMGTQNPNNVAPRLTGLRDGGLVEPCGRRANRGGHNMAVWRLTDKGKAALRGANTESGGMGNYTTHKVTQERGDVNGGAS